MQNLHQRLTSKYPQYHNWHQTKHHNTIHWGVLVVFTLLVFGTISRWTPISFAADTAMPTTPTNLTATAVSSSQINLSWTASTDNVAVTGYKIYRCAGLACAPTTQIATSATNSYSNTGLTASTTYTYAVSAYDAAGNESGKSVSVNTTIQASTGTNRYMALTGVDTGNCSNESSSCRTLQYVFSQMSGGDTLYIDDGVYTDLGNKIWQFNAPPSGAPGKFTVIRAKNIPCQNGIPCDQPLKVKFSGDAKFAAIGPGTVASSYVKFWGIRWDEIATYLGWDHLYFKQVASQGMTDGNTAAIVIWGDFNVLEDVVAFGKGRYKILFYKSPAADGNNLCRRCVIRHDWANKNDITSMPIAGIASYYNRGTACLNCIVIDSDTPSEWHNSSTEISGAFAQVVDDGPHAFIIKGSLAINTAMAAYNNRQGSSGHVIQDFVAIKTAGGLALQGETSVDRATLIDIGTNNFSYRSVTQKDTIQAPDDGIFTFRSDIQKIVNNSIMRNILDDGMDGGGITNNYINMHLIGDQNYTSSLQATNFYTTDPFLNGLKYPIRIEENSTLQNQGSNGSQIGARIINKLGVDGSEKNEINWDAEQGSLWPWPLEKWISAEIKTSQYTINSNRGFAADGNDQFGKPLTLTRYIWQYLGNQIPCEIYNECGGVPDTTAPTTPTNLTATAVSSSQINLSWTASTDPPNGEQAISGVAGYKIYRCAGSTCAPTTQIATSATNSYSNTGLTASTAYTYAVSAYDAAGNESEKSGTVSAATLSQFKPSDLNQDTKVDNLDFDILKQDWNRTDKPKSDLNQDGIVDSRDLGIMMSEWAR